MVEQSLVDRKLEISRRLAARLVEAKAPLLAAYWEWRDEKGRWELYLVPNSLADERKLIGMAADILVEAPYRSEFTLMDVVVDGRQVERARALAAYIRRPEDMGRRFDTTFTGGQYFEGVIVVYVAPQLASWHHAA